MNISYCRMENTLKALQKCYNAEFKVESQEEHDAMVRLIKLCATIAKDFEYEVTEGFEPFKSDL